ncbi:hypothetical protein PIROE2DRAFT_61028 [Piromyces sp. E2]|nr:hypothetical protein PIROE2DRAFT_61028 [Piromyces sp. E2]|eukprot:OUM63844.1 hypothetical protein PIROE2DRAFT_61028 [Piromyces sp. E2]
MDSHNVDDSYLRATRSARIERMRKILPLERRAPNTVSNIRMSNVIRNRNDVTPSYNNRKGYNNSNSRETWNEKKTIIIDVEDDEADKTEENNDDMNEKTETDQSKLKPASPKLPDFILSGNRSTPLRISSHEILSSKKSSQLIQRLQDDFIKSHKHSRSPGIDFSSYRLSAKKPRTEIDIRQDDPLTGKAFSDDQYEDNPFMPSTSHSMKKKQLSIIIDDDSEQPTESEPISISETEPEQLSNEHLESIKKKLSEHSLYVKELKEGIRNKLNKSKIATTNTTTNQEQTNANKDDENSFTIIESKDTTNSSSSSSSTTTTTTTPIQGSKRNIIEEVNRRISLGSPTPKPVNNTESSQENSTIVISSTVSISQSNDESVEVIEETQETPEQYSFVNRPRNKDTNDLENNNASTTKKDTPIDFDKFSVFHRRSSLDNSDNPMMIIDEEQQSQPEEMSSIREEMDDVTEGTSNDQREIISIEDSTTSSNQESEKEVGTTTQNENKDDNTEVDNPSTDKIVIEEDSEDNEVQEVYIIHLDKSPKKRPLTHTPTSSSSTPSPYRNKTPTPSGSDRHSIGRADDHENSPLSKKSATILPHHYRIPEDSSFGENEIIKMDRPLGTAMDIDIISVGDTSNSSTYEEKEEEMKIRETTPEIDKSLSLVEMNSSDDDDDDDNTILFSSGNTTPIKFNTNTKIK